MSWTDVSSGRDGEGCKGIECEGGNVMSIVLRGEVLIREIEMNYLHHVSLYLSAFAASNYDRVRTRMLKIELSYCFYILLLIFLWL